MTNDMNISEMLAEQLNRLFGEHVTRDLLVSVEQGTPATQLWNELEQLGITAALVDEEAGGAGLSWADIEPSIAALGKHGAPIPLAETFLAHWLLAQTGIDIPAGPIAVSAVIFNLDSNNQLDGIDQALAWAPSCQYLVAIVRRDNQLFTVLIESSKVSMEALNTLSREPQAKVTLAKVQAFALAQAPETVGSLGLLPFMASIRAIQIGGALEQLLALCVEYGNTREQFGRPIGKFQAIQHAIAELASQTAAAQVAGLYACRQMDKGNTENAAMISKTRAGQAAGRGAEIAHQVFGAIGFTDEHSLHYFTRRLWQWRSEAGSEFWWAEQLGQQVIAAGGDALWPSITH